MTRAAVLLLTAAAFCAYGRPPDPRHDVHRRAVVLEEELFEFDPDAKHSFSDEIQEEVERSSERETGARKALLSIRSAIVQELKHRSLLSKKSDHLAEIYRGSKKIGEAFDKEVKKINKKDKRKGLSKLWHKMTKIMPAPIWIIVFVLVLAAVISLIVICVKISPCMNNAGHQLRKKPLPQSPTHGELVGADKPPFGTMNYSLEYDIKRNCLTVTVNNCYGLPKGLESIDPYVIVTIDKEKPGMEKSKIIKESSNPVFNYSRKFKIKDRSQLKNKVITIEIFDWDIAPNHRMIARKVIKLSSIGDEVLDKILGRPHFANVNLSQGLELPPQGVGDICVSIAYSSFKKRLIVHVIECKAVFLQSKGKRADLDTLPNTFMQISVSNIPGKKPENRKSSLVKQSRNPYFNFSCTFSVEAEKLNAATITLELVHKTETLGIKRPIGFLKLSSSCDKASLCGMHWDEIVYLDGSAVSKWHALEQCSM